MEETAEIIQIDGSLHEGGGQIIRSSMALANILQKTVKITSIRKSRPNPGLNNQLLGAIKLMQEITKAEVVGVKSTSQIITYTPQIKVQAGNYKGGSQSASAISLMAQSLIPTLCFAKEQSQLRLLGGTDVNKSPPCESITRILKPLLARMGVNFKYETKFEGYYPRGGGQIQLTVNPVIENIKPITLLKKGFILTDTCDRPFKEFLRPLKKDITAWLVAKQSDITEEDIIFDVDAKKINNKKYRECYSAVAHAFGEDTYLDFSCYNDDNLSLDVVCDKLFENFKKNFESGGCLDEHNQDQLLLFMGLAKGESQIRVGNEITEHSLASFYVLKQFLPEVQISVIDEVIEEKETKVIKIVGVGIENVK